MELLPVYNILILNQKVMSLHVWIWFCHKAAIKQIPFGVAFYLSSAFLKNCFYILTLTPPAVLHTILPWPHLPGQWDLQGQGGHSQEVIILPAPGLSPWNRLASARPSVWADCFGLRTFFEGSAFLIIKTQDAVTVALAAFCFLRVWQNSLISFPHN